jgi:hypothetical protein
LHQRIVNQCLGSALLPLGKRVKAVAKLARDFCLPTEFGDERAAPFAPSALARRRKAPSGVPSRYLLPDGHFPAQRAFNELSQIGVQIVADTP